MSNTQNRFEFAAAYGSAKYSNKCIAIFNTMVDSEHPAHRLEPNEYIYEGIILRYVSLIWTLLLLHFLNSLVHPS